MATGAWTDDTTFTADVLEGLYRVRDAKVTGRSGDVLRTTEGDIEVSPATRGRGGHALGHHLEKSDPADVGAGDRVVAMGRIDPSNGDLDAVMMGTVTGH